MSDVKLEDLSNLPVETDKTVDKVEEREINISKIKGLATMEGFENELAIVDNIIMLRTEFLNKHKESLMNMTLSEEELATVNMMMNQLTNDVMGKVKLIKSAKLQEEKANNEAALVELAMSLIKEKSINANVLKEMKVVNTEEEVKTLNNFEFTDDEMKD